MNAEPTNLQYFVGRGRPEGLWSNIPARPTRLQYFSRPWPAGWPREFSIFLAAVAGPTARDARFLQGLLIFSIFVGRGRRDGRGGKFYCRASGSSIFLAAVAGPTARGARFPQGLLIFSIFWRPWPAGVFQKQYACRAYESSVFCRPWPSSTTSS